MHINKVGTFVFRAEPYGFPCHNANVRDVSEMDGVVHGLKKERGAKNRKVEETNKHQKDGVRSLTLVLVPLD